MKCLHDMLVGEMLLASVCRIRLILTTTRPQITLLYRLQQIGAEVQLSHFRLIMGGVLGKNESPSSPKASVPETKLEAKITEAMLRRETEGSSIRSFDSLVLKFPKIDENLRKCKVIFQEFGRLAAHPLSSFYLYHFGNVYLHISTF